MNTERPAEMAALAADCRKKKQGTTNQYDGCDHFRLPHPPCKARARKSLGTGTTNCARPMDAFLAVGTPVILDIDVYGKVNFDKVYPEAVGILIVPPSLEVLEQRLRGRGTDSDETIALRLKNAVDEYEST